MIHTIAFRTGDIDLKRSSIMLATPLFVAACIYYKRTKSKCNDRIAGDTNKQSKQNGKHPKPSESNNPDETTTQSDRILKRMRRKQW
uniref:Secreted protein n=1 Tax=Loa loa TaxID=7209 RepID=A0A1I7VGC6_LOALO